MKVTGSLRLNVSATMELDENEMRVLDYLIGFGAENVRKHLGGQISEADLKRAFDGMRAQLNHTLGAASRIRDYMNHGAPHDLVPR